MRRIGLGPDTIYDAKKVRVVREELQVGGGENFMLQVLKNGL